MDDQTKSQIRKALAWDFWRWTIGILLLVAILLWIWISSERHGHLIWLTLVPLIFLLPVYRSYRASRILTETETTEVSEGSKTIPADESEKNRIRRRAKVTVTIADIVLLLALIVALLYYTFRQEGPEAYSQNALNDTRYALLRALWDYEDQIQREVALFVPPTKAADYPEWGEAVYAHLKQPAAVFVRDHGTTSWAFRSPDLSISDSAFEARMAEIESKSPKRGIDDTTGVFVIRYIGISTKSHKSLVKEDSTERFGRLFRPVGEDRAWGFLVRRPETWISYCQRLKQAEERKSSDPIESIGERASTILNVQTIGLSKNWSAHPTARVYLFGKEIYRTPALDTAAVSLIDTLQGARVELYSSSMDKVYKELSDTSYFPWGRIAIIVFLFGVLHFCWLWIKKLTA